MTLLNNLKRAAVGEWRCLRIKLCCQNVVKNYFGDCQKEMVYFCFFLMKLTYYCEIEVEVYKFTFSGEVEIWHIILFYSDRTLWVSLTDFNTRIFLDFKKI